MNHLVSILESDILYVFHIDKRISLRIVLVGLCLDKRSRVQLIDISIIEQSIHLLVRGKIMSLLMRRWRKWTEVIWCFR